MYYVSRKDSRGRYYITDTEDGVEEYVPKDTIRHLLNSGVEIKGAEIQMRPHSSPLVLTVQLPVSAQRASRLMAQGLDIVVLPDGTLLHFNISSSFKGNKVFVFGDYCISLASGVLSVPSYDDRVFIFDDRIKSVDEKWINTRKQVGFKVDVTKVTNISVLLQIYRSLIDEPFCIIDDRKRFMQYMPLVLLSKGEPLHEFYGFAFNRKIVTMAPAKFPDKLILQYMKPTLLKDAAFLLDKPIKHKPYPSDYKKIYRLMADTNCKGPFTLEQSRGIEACLYHLQIKRGKKPLVYVVSGGQDPEIKAVVTELAAKLYNIMA